MDQAVSVFGGAGIGSVLRYAVSTTGLLAPPLATLSVNLAGSFMLGYLAGYASSHSGTERLLLLLGVGFCGGLTTMSTFALDLAKFVQAGDWTRMVIYSFGTVLACLGLCLLGLKLAS